MDMYSTGLKIYYSIYSISVLICNDLLHIMF